MKVNIELDLEIYSEKLMYQYINNFDGVKDIVDALLHDLTQCSQESGNCHLEKIVEAGLDYVLVPHLSIISKGESE